MAHTKTRRTTKLASRSATATPGEEPTELWLEYKRTGSETIKNRLIEHYLPIVRYTAERLAAKLPQNVDVDDLQSAGIFGLMDAIDGFDPARGVKFKTYCSPRIRGAILDELRAIDWVPRLVRTKANILEERYRELEAALGRRPTDVELAQQLGMSLEQLDDFVKEASAITVVSLTEKWQDNDQDKSVRTIDLLEDRRQDGPIEELQRKDVMEVLSKELTVKERMIVILYYFEELTMREIGLTLDLSESRVCQLHSRIVARLRAKLGTRARELRS
jgi:RNA polymerase sigma factor for flagellar operon FliA